ncbi:MAG TPA: hydrolase [Thermoanaerobaculia bacterium]|nr:hydrolase [Thermoanaerobaculia bacterium]
MDIDAAQLTIPPRPVAAVVFATAPALPDDHRDEAIARDLYALGVATIRVPLLTVGELMTPLRSDAEVLADRFILLTQWIRTKREVAGIPIALAASSCAAAGAIIAAAQQPQLASAVVAIDGRTDLAVDVLRELRTPTLLLVRDMPVLRMNREALAMMRCERRLEIVHEGSDALATKCVNWLADKFALVPADAYGMV